MRKLDHIMEAASLALVGRDYLTCETQCIEALRMARRDKNWAYYARILMPMQEARRQRRMIAAQGSIRLGTADLNDEPAQWLAEYDRGCVVVTHPHSAEVARRLAHTSRDQRRYVEVLFVDNTSQADSWVLRSYEGPDIRSSMAAPPTHLINRWLIAPASWQPSNQNHPSATAAAPHDTTAASAWFLDACEQLGDTALNDVNDPLPPAEKIAALEACLQVVTDHEILHQRLGEAARLAVAED